MSKKDQEKLEQQEELQKALAKIEKDYGKGTVISAGSKPQTYDIISSGSLGLDIALGVWGFAKGKTYEFLGWESSGKSTETLEVIAQAQSQGELCALIDGEHSFDPIYAKAVGVDVEKLLISQPEYGEQGYDVAERLMKSGKIGVLIIDSQTSLLPKKVIDTPMGEGGLGKHATLMSEAVPKLMTAAATNNVLLIFISQLREKIGVMFGSPETTNGGHALKFYAHGRLRFSKTAMKDGDTFIKNRTTVKVIKNKLAPPFTIAIFDIVYGLGIDRQGELIDIATDLEVIQKSGSWFAYNENKIGQGRDSVIQFLKDNPELMAEIKEKVLVKLHSGKEIDKISTVKQGKEEPEDYVEE